MKEIAVTSCLRRVMRAERVHLISIPHELLGVNDTSMTELPPSLFVTLCRITMSNNEMCGTSWKRSSSLPT